MKTLHRSLVLLLAAGVTACSTTRVKTDFDADIKFDTYQSYSWSAPVDSSGRTPFETSTLLGKRIKNAVNSELASHGFTERRNGSVDFLITYTVNIEEKLDVSAPGYDHVPSYYRYSYWAGFYSFGYWPGYYGYGYGSGYYRDGGVHVDQYKEVTITLDVLDPATGELVWRGWFIDEVDDGEISRLKIENAVRRILKKFPPEKIKDISITMAADLE